MMSPCDAQSTSRKLLNIISFNLLIYKSLSYGKETYSCSGTCGLLILLLVKKMKRSFSEINDSTEGDFFKGGENE